MVLIPHTNTVLGIRCVGGLLHGSLGPVSGFAHPPEDDGRVDGDEDTDGDDHDGGIQTDKVALARDQVALPALGQLHRPVDAPDVDHDEADQHGGQGHAHAPGDVGAEVTLAAGHAAVKVGDEDAKDGHGEELKDDASHHDVGPLVLRGDGIGQRGLGAADGLDHEGDEIAGAKDDGIHPGREHGRTAPEVDDEFAEEDVEGGGEEDGGDDEGDDLAEEGIVAVWTFGGVGTGGPTYQFGYCRRKKKKNIGQPIVCLYSSEAK